MVDGASGVTNNSNADTKTTSTTNAGSVDKNMFLQLLVAQLRNQDPLNPSDGTEFVGQLAQFQQLENGVNMSQDIAAIRARLDAIDTAGSQS